MSIGSILIKTQEGHNLYTLVASVHDNFDAFRKHMIEKGIIIREMGIPGAYYAEYSATNRGNLAAMYFMRTMFGVLNDDDTALIIAGPLLAVSGLEEEIVNREAQELINRIEESEDPESVQFYIARLRQKASDRII